MTRSLNFENRTDEAGDSMRTPGGVSVLESIQAHERYPKARVVLAVIGAGLVALVLVYIVLTGGHGIG